MLVIKPKFKKKENITKKQVSTGDLCPNLSVAEV